MVVRQLYRDNIYVILHLFLTFAMMVAIMLVLHEAKRQRIPVRFKAIGWFFVFLLVSEIWFWTDSALAEIVNIDKSTILFFNYCTSALMAVSFLKFTEKLLDKKDRWVTVFASVVTAIVVCMAAAWKFFGFPAVSNFWITAILVAACVVVILFYAISEYIRRRDSVSFSILIGMAVLCLTALFACIYYVSNQNNGYLRIFAIGSCVFYISLLFPIFSDLLDQLNRKANADYYKKIAYEDALTGLYNRSRFNKGITGMDKADEDRQRNRCVLVLDINNLKYANDMFGHAEGDLLIQSAAEIISSSFSALGRCYRIGGDEFAVIIEASNRHQVHKAIELMETEERKRQHLLKVPIAIAYGEAWNDRPGINMNMDRLLQIADDRMYEKKRQMKSLDA